MVNPITAERRVFSAHWAEEVALAESDAEWLREISRSRSWKFLRRWTRHHEEISDPPEERTPIFYTADGMEV